MPAKKTSYISWLGENLVESAKNFDSSLSTLLQVESKNISSVLENLDESILSDNTDELDGINDMLCETLKYVESIQNILSKKALIGLYAMNYDTLKDKPSNEAIIPKEEETQAGLDTLSESNTNNINNDNADDNIDDEMLDFENSFTTQDILQMKNSPDCQYEVIDLGIQLNNNAEIIINTTEEFNEELSNDEPYYDSSEDIPEDVYEDNCDKLIKDKIIYPPASQKVSSSIITAENTSKVLPTNVKRTLTTIDDNSSLKSTTNPKVDVKFDDLIEIQIDTTVNKTPICKQVAENITNDNLLNIPIDNIIEYKACESPKDITLSNEEKNLVESFGFFRNYYKIKKTN